MATPGEEEPLDGDCGEYGSYGEEEEEEEEEGEEEEEEDEEGDDDDADSSSTADDGNGSSAASSGNEMAARACVPFPEAERRESLGFLQANRKIALPGASFDKKGDGDDWRAVALAALDRFGLLLVSSATGG